VKALVSMPTTPFFSAKGSPRFLPQKHILWREESRNFLFTKRHNRILLSSAWGRQRYFFFLLIENENANVDIQIQKLFVQKGSMV
jgi:hypothetical protein